ncbi:hypothetical protein ACWGDX_23670 [Streptomyces sp. NPDC055025]
MDVRPTHPAMDPGVLLSEIAADPAADRHLGVTPSTYRARFRTTTGTR